MKCVGGKNSRNHQSLLGMRLACGFFAFDSFLCRWRLSRLDFDGANDFPAASAAAAAADSETHRYLSLSLSLSR